MDSRFYAPEGTDPELLLSVVARLWGTLDEEAFNGQWCSPRNGYKGWEAEPGGSLGHFGITWRKTNDTLFGWFHTCSTFNDQPHGIMLSFPGMTDMRQTLVHRLAELFGGIALYNDCDQDVYAEFPRTALSFIENDPNYTEAAETAAALKPLTKKDKISTEALRYR